MDYLLVYPPSMTLLNYSPTHGMGYPAIGVVDQTPPSRSDIWCNAIGVYVNGKLAKAPAGERVWIYSPHGAKAGVRPCPGTAGADGEVPYWEFGKLEDSRLWKEKIMPELDRETKRLEQEMRARAGPPKHWVPGYGWETDEQTAAREAKEKERRDRVKARAAAAKAGSSAPRSQ